MREFQGRFREMVKVARSARETFGFLFRFRRGRRWGEVALLHHGESGETSVPVEIRE